MNMSTEEYKLKVCATLDLIALELCTIRCNQDAVLAELRRQGGARTDAVRPRYEKIPEKWAQILVPKIGTDEPNEGKPEWWIVE